ncbi:RHS repeat-associated core domain-containing protein [Nocardiopsis suaedae]|uniref:RHS repeat-associated core domain-containing protein n=1 Tax=Nocardiopsis suaedae TaxID=3018444 RepID=A0ABT4TJT6_9ACTN|nr:RHS repeat-associated core domain-containing protein [Nocardiopsis suaedae]MDA2804929.1 RHS repeat-associated core domain-containing protein [Nocardiopsis suaedae]
MARVDQSGHGGESVSTYEYDEAGNMVRRNSEDGDQQLTWDAEGNLAGVTGGAAETDYVYDADGERLIRRQGAEWTLYLPGQEVTWTAGEDTTEATRYYEHAGETVAVRDGEGLYWLFSDHNGSSQLAVDARTGETVQRRYTPFGELRSSSASWPGDKGYVGGTVDEATGLTQLGARAYDASIGRFISVDPLMKADDSQQMHGYAYANNSPVASSDASGLLMMGPGGCGCTSPSKPSGHPTSRRDSGYSVPQGNHDLRQRRQELMWIQQGRNVSRMRQGSGVYQRPYFQDSRSSFYTGARGSAPAPTYIDPYDNDSHRQSASEKAQQQAESDQNWAESAWDWTVDNWGTISTWAGIGAFGVCVFVSAGACAVAGGVLWGANIFMDGAKNNWDGGKMNWKKHAVDGALYASGVGAARVAAGSVRGMFSSPRVKPFWDQNPRSGNPQRREGFWGVSPESARTQTRANYMDNARDGMIYNGHGLYTSGL